jgi:hypothetical protein
LNNFTKIGMPILVVLFLLIAAISITMTVTKENTLKQVAAAANTPVSNIETQLARGTQSQIYVENGQANVPIPDQATVNTPANDYISADSVAQASCHGSGTQVSGTTTGYRSGGCGGGSCRGNTGQLSSPAAGSAGGASCH